MLEDIFEYAAGYNRSRSLAKFALVCRNWRGPAQRALNTTLDLQTSKQARGWLASAARKRYDTKHLKIGQWNVPALGLEVLENCPRLRSLALENVAYSGFELYTSKYIAGIHRLSLRSPGRRLPPSRGAAAVQASLRHLELHLEYSGSLGYEEVQRIIGSSIETLTTLHLVTSSYNGVGEDVLDYLVAQPLKNVKHLVMVVAYLHADKSSWPTVIDSFPALTTLDIISPDKRVRDSVRHLKFDSGFGLWEESHRRSITLDIREKYCKSLFSRTTTT
ncbi:hypothetical protein RQP46_007491 [Phenoliferia psychrophenolica]